MDFGNYIGCDNCSFRKKECAGSGKIWRSGDIYIGGCSGCGSVYIMRKLN